MEYDVKKALKDAKEFIKNKEYTSALDTCKVKWITTLFSKIINQ